MMKSSSPYSKIKETDVWLRMSMKKDGTILFHQQDNFCHNIVEKLEEVRFAYKLISRSRDMVVLRYVGRRCAPHPYMLFQRIRVPMPDELVVELF